MNIHINPSSVHDIEAEMNHSIRLFDRDFFRRTILFIVTMPQASFRNFSRMNEK